MLLVHNSFRCVFYGKPLYVMYMVKEVKAFRATMILGVLGARDDHQGSCTMYGILNFSHFKMSLLIFPFCSIFLGNKLLKKINEKVFKKVFDGFINYIRSGY
jgi:hypothetical protein